MYHCLVLLAGSKFAESILDSLQYSSAINKLRIEKRIYGFK
nr:MAG TPA: hypothetical protein [Caudoviricetes sp.]DAV28911.1 MAG TPA: hypothetical protein [Caudoviricetes sp.]